MRREIRYSINYMEYQKIMQLLKKVMAKDKNAKTDGTYKIKTMYLDNYYGEVRTAKKQDINSVKKYRVRMYNDNIESIYLERKTNENGYILKKKIPIDKKTVENIIVGDIKDLLEEELSLKSELYLAMNLKQLRPSFVLQYERIAFTDDVSRARITIDKNIQSTTNCYKFFENIEGTHNENMILEVKYETYLPNYIRDIIKTIESKQISSSKFRNETQKMEDRNEF